MVIDPLAKDNNLPLEFYPVVNAGKSLKLKTDFDHLIFYHIGKTGGNVVVDVISRLLGTMGKTTIWDSHITDQNIDEIFFICGHDTLRFHMKLKGASTYMTFLREPISRLQSIHRHWKDERFSRHPQTDWRLQHEYVKDKTFEQWIESGPNFTSQVDTLKLVHPNWEIMRDPIPAVELGLKTHFTFIGITELMEESLFLLCDRYQFPRLPLWSLTYTNRKPAETSYMSRKLRTKMEDLLAPDLELYWKCRAKIESQFSNADFGDIFLDYLKDLEQSDIKDLFLRYRADLNDTR